MWIVLWCFVGRTGAWCKNESACVPPSPTPQKEQSTVLPSPSLKVYPHPLLQVTSSAISIQPTTRKYLISHLRSRNRSRPASRVLLPAPPRGPQRATTYANTHSQSHTSRQRMPHTAYTHARTHTTHLRCPDRTSSNQSTAAPQRARCKSPSLSQACRPSVGAGGATAGRLFAGRAPAQAKVSGVVRGRKPP
jgi:hypothetical protein